MRDIYYIGKQTTVTLVLFSIAGCIGAAAQLFVANLFAHQQQRIETALRRLAVYVAENATQPKLEQRLLQIRQATESFPGLMREANATLAGAQLEGDLRAIVQRGRGEIRSTQVLP